MKIIGEKINGTRKRVAQAIAERDAAFIADLAQRQVEAGAAWLDVNAGTMPAQEPDDLIWLIDTIQAVVDIPLSLDSAILDPLDREIRAAILTTQLLLGRDPHCLTFIRASRKGAFEKD